MVRHRQITGTTSHARAGLRPAGVSHVRRRRPFWNHLTCPSVAGPEVTTDRPWKRPRCPAAGHREPSSGRQPRLRAGTSAPRSSSSFCGEGDCGLTGRRGDGVGADDLLPDLADALDVADELVAELEETGRCPAHPDAG